MDLQCGICIFSGVLLCFASLVSAQVGGVAIGGDLMVDGPFGEMPSPFLAMAAQDSANTGPTTVLPLIPAISGDTGTQSKPTVISPQIGGGFNPSDVLSAFAGTGPGVAINPTGTPTDYVIENPPRKEQPPQTGIQGQQGASEPSSVQIDPITGKEYTLQNEAYTPMGSVGHLVKVPVNRNDHQNVPQTGIAPANKKAAVDHVIIEPVINIPPPSPKPTQQSAPFNTGDQKPSQVVSDRFNPGSGMADEIAALQSSKLLGSPVDMSNFLPPPFNPSDVQSSGAKETSKPGSVSVPFSVPVISEFTVDRTPDKAVNAEVPASTGLNSQPRSNLGSLFSNPKPSMIPQVQPAADTKRNQGVRVSLRDMFSGGQTLDKNPAAADVSSNPDPAQNKAKDIPHLQDLTAEGLFPFEGNSMARDATLPGSKDVIQDMNKAISKHNKKESLHIENPKKGVNEIPPLTGTNGGPITNMVGAKPPGQIDQNKDSTSPSGSATGLPTQGVVSDKPDSKAPGSFIIGAGTPNAQLIQTGLVSNPVSPTADSTSGGGVALGGAIPELGGISVPRLSDQVAAVENLPAKDNKQPSVDMANMLPPPLAPNEIVPTLPSEIVQNPSAKAPSDRILSDVPSTNELSRLLSLTEGTVDTNNNNAFGIPSSSPLSNLNQRPTNAAGGRTIPSESIQGSLPKAPTDGILRDVPSTNELDRLLSLSLGSADVNNNIGLDIPSSSSLPGSTSNQEPTGAAVVPNTPPEPVQSSPSNAPIDGILRDVPSTETLNRLLALSQDSSTTNNNVGLDIPSIISLPDSNKQPIDSRNRMGGINVPVANIPKLSGLDPQAVSAKTDTLPPDSLLGPSKQVTSLEQLSDPKFGNVPQNPDMINQVGRLIQMPSDTVSPKETPSVLPSQSPALSQQIVNVKPGWLTNVFGSMGNEPTMQPDLNKLGLPGVLPDQVNAVNNKPNNVDLSKLPLNPMEQLRVKDAVRNTLGSNIGPMLDKKRPVDFIDSISRHSTGEKKPDAVDIIPLGNRLLQPNQGNGIFSLGAHRVIDTMPPMLPNQRANLPDYQTQNVIGTSETKPLGPDSNTQLNNIQISSMSITPRREQLRRMMMQQDASLAMSSPERPSQDLRSVLTSFEAPGMSFGQAVPVQETMKRNPNIVTIAAESNVPINDNKPSLIQQPIGMSNDVSNVKNTPLSFQLGLSETRPSDPNNQQNFLFNTASDLGKRTSSQDVTGSNRIAMENPSIGAGQQTSNINILDSFASGTRLGQPVATPNANQAGTIQMIGNSIVPMSSGPGDTLPMGSPGGNLPTETDPRGRGIMLPMSADAEATQFTSGSRQAVFGGSTDNRPLGTGIKDINRPEDYNKMSPKSCNSEKDPFSQLHFKLRQNGIEYRFRCALGTKYDPIDCDCSTLIKPSEDCLEVHMDFNNGKVEDSSQNKLPIGNENVVVTNKSMPSNGIALFNSDGKLTVWRYQNYDFRETVMLKVQFRPSQIGDRIQPLISNCDGDVEGPSIGIIYDNMNRELHLQLKTINQTRRTLKFKINPEEWNDVTYIYDGREFIGIVNGIRRYVSRTDPHLLGIIGGKMESIATTGLVEIRDAGLILGHCPRMGYYNGAMVDIQIYTCIPKNFRLEK